MGGTTWTEPEKTELQKKEAKLTETIKNKLPDFFQMIASAVEENKPEIILHQDAFASDYQEEEFTLLGRAIKYAGLHGINLHVIGANRSTLTSDNSVAKN